MIPLKKQIRALQRILDEVLPGYYASQVRLSKMERKDAEAEFLAIRYAVATLMMTENSEAGSFLKKLESLTEDRQSAMDCVLLTIEDNSRLIAKHQEWERFWERLKKQLIRRGILEEIEQEQKNEVANGS